jgi:hypothetical protein
MKQKRDEFIDYLSDGNLTFNKYGVLLLLNDGTPPAPPSVAEITKFAGNVYEEFTSRKEFYDTVMDKLGLAGAGDPPLISGFHTTYENINQFIGILERLKDTTEVTRKEIVAYRIITHMMLMNTRAYLLPKNILDNLNVSFRRLRGGRLQKIL